jgi:hypothetical protein
MYKFLLFNQYFLKEYSLPLNGPNFRDESDDSKNAQSPLERELERQQRNDQLLHNQQTLQRLISLEHTTVTLNKRMLAEAGFEYRGCNKICYKCYKCLIMMFIFYRRTYYVPILSTDS